MATASTPFLRAAPVSPASAVGHFCRPVGISWAARPAAALGKLAITYPEHVLIQAGDCSQIDRRNSPDARVAGLRGHPCDLMEIEAFVADAIRRAMLVAPVTVEGIDEYAGPST